MTYQVSNCSVYEDHSVLSSDFYDLLFFLVCFLPFFGQSYYFILVE